jgi:voltage-gated potassium channel
LKDALVWKWPLVFNAGSSNQFLGFATAAKFVIADGIASGDNVHSPLFWRSNEMATQAYRWRHLVLLISILLLFTITPLVVTFRHGILVLNIIGATVLVAASYALSERKRLFLIAIILSAISIIGTWLLLVFSRHWAVLVSHACLIILLAFFSITILDYVLRSGKVTTDRIFAAVCVYMLIGFAWAFAYAFLEEIAPGSFVALPETGRSDYVARVQQLRYFSFMTLTTVGYGDVVPRSAAARTMAVLEAVMGQIYLAVLVARLVGLHIVHATGLRSSDKD